MTRAALRVVATPIGNLADLSPRAAEVLRESSLVLAEDTRRAKTLLEAAGSSARVVSCHQHNEEARVSVVKERLLAGESVALVTDAGAPGVSDPGGRLVDAIAAAGLRVEVIPGPSALVAALMGAGLVSHRFAFLGFLPRKKGARRRLLERIDRELALVVFEAPGRADATLRDLAEVLGERRVVVGRELTKRFETFHRGVLGRDLEPPLVDKGEMVIVIEAGTAAEAPAPIALPDDEGAAPKERAKALARRLGVSTREAYARLVERREGLAATAAPVRRSLERSSAARARVMARLSEAAEALFAAELAAAEAQGREAPSPTTDGLSSEIPGADLLLSLLSRPPSLPAPVEAAELARALLAALSAADALEDALSFASDGLGDEGVREP